MREAARSQATRSGRVPQSAIDEKLKSFDDKDLRLRSVGKDVRKREAKRRLMDIKEFGPKWVVRLDGLDTRICPIMPGLA